MGFFLAVFTGQNESTKAASRAIPLSLCSAMRRLLNYQGISSYHVFVLSLHKPIFVLENLFFSENGFCNPLRLFSSFICTLRRLRSPTNTIGFSFVLGLTKGEIYVLHRLQSQQPPSPSFYRFDSKQKSLLRAILCCDCPLAKTAMS